MRGLFIKMQELVESASATDKIILLHLLKNPSDAINKSIRELASATYTSPSTITRLCRKLGFEGYKDFRLSVSYEIALSQKSFDEEKKMITQFDSLQDIVDKITYKNKESLEDTKNLVDYNMLNRAVKMICDCQLIAFYGVGSSLLVAQDAYLKFLRVGKACVVNIDGHTQLLQARNMTKNHLAIVLSYSGQTHEVIECIKIMKENEVPIITITRYGSSPVALAGDCNLYVAANEPLFRSGAMSSRISQLNVIDVLYSAYVSRNYESAMKRLSASRIFKQGI